MYIYKSYYGDDLNNYFIKSVFDLLKNIYYNIDPIRLEQDIKNYDSDMDTNGEQENERDRRTEGEFSGSSSEQRDSQAESDGSTPQEAFELLSRGRSSGSECFVPNQAEINLSLTESNSAIIIKFEKDNGVDNVDDKGELNTNENQSIEEEKYSLIENLPQVNNNDIKNINVEELSMQRKRSKQSVKSSNSKTSKNSKKLKEIEEEEEAVEMIRALSISSMKGQRKMSKDDVMVQSRRTMSSSFGMSRSTTNSHSRKHSKSSQSLTLDGPVPVVNIAYSAPRKSTASSISRRKACCSTSTRCIIQ